MFAEPTKDPLFIDLCVADAAQVETLFLRYEPSNRHDVIGNSIREAFTSIREHESPKVGTDHLLAPPYLGRAAIHHQEMVGAVLVKNLGGGAAVISSAAITEADQRFAERLWADIAQVLKNLGIQFVQWMRGIEQDATLVELWGFRKLATLDYLSASPLQILKRCGTDDSLPASRNLNFRPASLLSDAEFIRLVQETYVDTLDCPTFFEYRTAAEVIESYRQVPGYQISDWQIMTNSDQSEQPLGCLIVTPYRASHILELTYMGLIPHARRQGYGRQVMRETARQGVCKDLQQIVLAVDRDNLPATKLYRGIGMEPIFAETAWVRRL